MKKQIIGLKKVILYSSVVYIVSLFTASLTSVIFDNGGFLPLTFGFALLIFTLYTLPVFFLFVFSLLYYREILVYKSTKNKKRLCYGSVSFAAFIVSFVLIYLYFLSVIQNFSVSLIAFGFSVIFSIFGKLSNWQLEFIFYNIEVDNFF